MRRLYVTIALLIGTLLVYSCTSDKDQREYDYHSQTTAAEPVEVQNNYMAPRRTTTTTNEIYERPKDTVSPYANNKLSSGEIPYENQVRLRGDDSRVEVTTHADREYDVVVILKQNGRIVKNLYIRGGQVTRSIEVPDGYYDVYFYTGKGWNPHKAMGGGVMGGFVIDEDFQEDPDNPVGLFNNVLTYELIRTVNGNFSTKQSSKGEIFQ